MKNLKNLSKAKIISNSEQKTILGGKLQQPNCNCFCYDNHLQMGHSCFDRCPDGSMPGQMIGNDPECLQNFNEL